MSGSDRDVYRARVVDAELAEDLKASGAVLIEGPRASGKTETGRHAAHSEVRLDVDDDARAAGLLAPSRLLEGDRPRLIDEWQLVPAVWNHVRRAVDDARGRPGQFILTGSAVPSDDVTRHSGALRILRMRMRPMSLLESGHSSGNASLASLLGGAEPLARDTVMSIEELARRIAVGGWPGLLGLPIDKALAALRGYVDQVSRVDLFRVDGVRRDPDKVQRVLRSLARHVAAGASARSIAADVGGPDGPIDYHTVQDYVAALARVFVVEDLPAWSPALRSRSTLRTRPTRHFVDPSIAVASLGAGPDRLLRDVRTLGLLFESLVVRDLRVYAQATDATVHHYRDNTGLEADAIVQQRDGRWAAIEVKLGQAGIEQGAASLRRVAERVDQDRHGPPAFLAVITGWGYAYRRPDGVDVIPIGTLGP